MPAAWSMEVVCTVAIFVLAQNFAHDNHTAQKS